MKMKRMILLLFSIIMVVVFTGCGNNSFASTGEDTEATVEPTKQIVTEITEAETEPPSAQAPATNALATSAPEEEYSDGEHTGLELAKMNMKDIISIMGGDYQTKKDIVSPAFSSEPINYYYNETTLPGFYFTGCLGTNGDFDTNEFSIAIIDGAKLNDSISSDMTYNELANILGDFDVQGVVASYTYYTTIDGHSVGFIFKMSDDLHQYAQTGTGIVSSDALKEVNPKLQSIGIRSYM